MAVGEWDQRQLCPDGACIGVIGPDGTCKVCGRAAPNWGDERNRGLIDPPDEDGDEEDDEDLAADGDEEDEDDDEDEDDEDDDEDDDDDDDEDDEDEDDDEDDEPGIAAARRGEWTARQLCPDGACIGVIGPDGRCKVCGRRTSDAAAEAPSSEPAAVSPSPAEPSSEPASAPVLAASSEPASTSAGPAVEPAIDSRAECGPEGCGTNSPVAAAAQATGDHEPCPTPDCSGHIGADGRCAVCGKGAS